LEDGVKAMSTEEERRRKRMDYQRPEVKKQYRLRGIRKWKQVFDFYGWECACCGEGNPAFLTIDHIHGDGKKDRNGSGRNIGAALRDLDRSKYQILCYNCNIARHCRGGGICPHKLIGGGII
jgi:hypothetical protein